MNAKKFLSTMIIVPILFAVSLIAQPFDFPVKPGTPEWKALTSHNEMQEVCQVPQSVLNSITTPDLLETCLNYPLYGDMMAYDRVQEGFDFVKQGFNGLRELLRRNDVGPVLIGRYRNMNPGVIDTNWTSIKKGEYSFKFFAIEILLAQDEVLNNLSKNDRSLLSKEAYIKMTAKQQLPEIYSSVAFTNNVLLMGRLMLKDKFAPFIKLVSDDTKLMDILQNASFISKEYMYEIVKLAEKYRKQN